MVLPKNLADSFIFLNKLRKHKQLKLDFHKALTKRIFKEKKGYLKFEDIILFATTDSTFIDHLGCMLSRIYNGKVAYSIVTKTNFTEPQIHKMLKSLSNRVALELELASEMYFDQDFPAYTVDPGLLNLLFKTSIKDKLVGVKRLFRNCLFLLPQGTYSHDGDVIEWLFVNDRDVILGIDSENKIQQYLDKLINDNLVNKLGYPIITHDDRPVTSGHTGRRLVVYAGNLTIAHRFYINFETDGSLNVVCTNNLREEIRDNNIPNICYLALQLLLFMQCSDCEQDEKTETSYQGVGFTQKDSNRAIRTFRHLELKDKNNTARKSTNHNEHSSPITHWRRGHWRNQPCGEKLQDSKIIWIQPTLINATVGE